MPEENKRCPVKRPAHETSLTPADISAIANQCAEIVLAKLSNRPQYLGREEMAQDLGVSVATMDNYVRQGFVPYMKLDRRVLFCPIQVREALIARSKCGAEVA